MIQPQPVAAQRDLFTLVEDFFANSFATDNVLITQAVRRMLAAGGKRLRPRLALLSAEVMGARAVDHLRIAAYMELIHVATLIHDDVVDHALTRRGVNATAVDFGNRISVLAGDYLFAWIFKNVTADYPPPVPNILSSTLADITDGEVLQLRGLGNTNMQLAEYMNVAAKKTGRLFAASCECGGIMGGGSAVAVQAVCDFGMHYGIAFQMQDDLLDMTADEAVIGKPVGNDLREKKMTIPVILALDGADREFRTDVERFYSGDDETRERIASIVRGIDAHGGFAKTKVAIAESVDRATLALAPLGNVPGRAEFVAIADALLTS